MNDDGKDPNAVSLLLLYSMILWGFCDARKVGRLDFAEITKRRQPLLLIRRYPQDLIRYPSLISFVHPFRVHYVSFMAVCTLCE